MASYRVIWQMSLLYGQCHELAQLPVIKKSNPMNTDVSGNEQIENAGAGVGWGIGLDGGGGGAQRRPNGIFHLIPLTPISPQCLLVVTKTRNDKAGASISRKR